VLAATLAVLVVAAGAFAATPASDRYDPVPFEETVAVGGSGVDVQKSRVEGFAIPRVQVYYSQVRYVVGYYGVASYAETTAGDRAHRQFGQPLAVHASDFAGTGAHLDDDGFLRVEAGRVAGWEPVGSLVVVVGSRARTASGPVAVPFSDRAGAAAFADEYGGDVVPWAAAVDRLDREAGAGDWTRELGQLTAERAAWADGASAAARSLLDRPVSTVVGPGESLAAAVDRAPPNTTVRIPPGTYEGGLVVDKPVTLLGAGGATHVRGNATGTVVRVQSPDVAVASLRVTGVGPNGTVSWRRDGGDREAVWDERIRLAYGRGDSAVRLAEANGSLLADVVIETPASGVIVHQSDGVVVHGVRIRGTDRPTEGFMGVLAMHSQVVVEASRVMGGRDGVYTHRADGSVVRDNRFEQLRFGLHEMYTSETLVANNTVRDADVGLIVMTRPSGNVLVDNDVRGSEVGISPAGSDSYVVGNVLVGNDYGLYVAGSRSTFAGNVVVGNEYGIRTGTVLPTNRVVGNDVVGNRDPVLAAVGPTRVWTDAGRGNYWGPVGVDRDGDGVVDRVYRPTAPVDARVTSAPGARTVAGSPALSALRQVQSSVPGLRSAGVVDTAPLAAPANPELVARVNATATRPAPQTGSEPVARPGRRAPAPALTGVTGG
jgi:parallel beta-helix repeat protein